MIHESGGVPRYGIGPILLGDKWGWVAAERLNLHFLALLGMVDPFCIRTLRILADGVPRSRDEICRLLRLPANQKIPQVWVALGQLDLVRRTGGRGTLGMYSITDIGRGYLRLLPS